MNTALRTLVNTEILRVKVLECSSGRFLDTILEES